MQRDDRVLAVLTLPVCLAAHLAGGARWRRTLWPAAIMKQRALLMVGFVVPHRRWEFGACLQDSTQIALVCILGFTCTAIVAYKAPLLPGFVGPHGRCHFGACLQLSTLIAFVCSLSFTSTAIVAYKAPLLGGFLGPHTRCHFGACLQLSTCITLVRSHSHSSATRTALFTTFTPQAYRAPLLTMVPH